MMSLQIFFKIAQSAIFALLLIGCAHSVSPQDKLSAQLEAKALWHDGSTDGLYGIGEDWSIEIQSLELETGTERLIVYHENLEPAEYEWVKDDSEDLSGASTMISQRVKPPVEFETITETIVLENKKLSYRLTDAVYNLDGTIGTPRIVEEHVTPAITEQVQRRVAKPARTVERMVPFERRLGFRRVVKTPARRVLRSGEKFVPIEIVKRPRGFIIKNPDGEVAHVFRNFENFTAFVNSLNQQVEELSGKTFKIIKVNDYVLPKESPQIMVRFESGEIHLVGTCNTTYGHYELTGNLFTLNAMGNLGQHACTQLFEMPDGRINERAAQTPDVITEDEFIALGDISLKIQSNQNELHFTDLSGETIIILER